jgi:RNA polymerase sigma-70 factor (ECF subfamily)
MGEGLDVRLQALDRGAWRDLYVAHRRLVRGVLAGCVGYSAELDDLTQQVFLTATSLVQSGRVVLRGDASGVRAWLVAIAARHGMAERRRRRSAPQPLLDEAPVPEEIDVGLDPIAHQALSRARAAWERLPEAVRLIWCLRRLERMTIDEIAAAVELSPATVKRRLVDADRQFAAMAEADPVLRDYLREPEAS